MVETRYSLAPARDSRLARARLALLGIWLGALLAFGGLFVPAAFAHLPTALAATLLGDGFGALDRGGGSLAAACCLLGAIDARRRGASGAEWLRALLPLAGALAHLASALLVTPKIHALRVAAGGGIGQLAPGDPQLAEFAWLHSASRALFGAATATAALACVWDLFPARASVSARASRDTESSDF
ncbi:MAG: DUF4149 domain-containing protein [Myxococcota bacterium]